MASAVVRSPICSCQRSVALACQDGRALAAAVLHQLGHVATLGSGQWGHRPVVEDQDGRRAPDGEQWCISAVHASQGELVEGSGGAAVDRR